MTGPQGSLHPVQDWSHTPFAAGGRGIDVIEKCEQITTLPRHLLGDLALGGPLSAALLEDVERGILRAIGVAL